MISKFWWGQGFERKIHWAKWFDLCDTKLHGGLGFRDLHMFNSALLAKQGWRLLSCPDSLCARVLKAKYFPHDDFLHSRLGHSPSFTWRSIWGIRPMLKKGVIWRVGTGESISTWTDNWIPRNNLLSPITPARNEAAVARVSSLINQLSRCWNEELVRQTFAPGEAELILRIPLSRTVTADSLYWLPSKSGLFSVRSVYRLIFDSAKTATSRPSSSSRRSHIPRYLWKWVWTAKIPSKVKHFLWRMLKDNLPTCTNLRRRGMKIDEACSRCHRSPETLSHIFWECDAARSFWLGHPLGLRSGNRPDSSFVQSFHSLASSLDTQARAFLFMGCWSLWHGRNSHVHDHNFIPTPLLLAKGSRLLDNFQEKARSHGAPPRWTLPPRGRWKLNFDASWNDDGARVGLGCAIRDCQGQVIISAASPLDRGSLSVVQAEAEAARWGMELALAIGCTDLILEGDCLDLINCLNGSSPSASTWYPLVIDLQTLGNNCRRISWCHIPRSFNSVADSLARFANGLQFPLVWLGSFPDFLLPVLLADLHQ